MIINLILVFILSILSHVSEACIKAIIEAKKKRHQHSFILQYPIIVGIAVLVSTNYINMLVIGICAFVFGRVFLVFIKNKIMDYHWSYISDKTIGNRFIKRFRKLFGIESDILIRFALLVISFIVSLIWII